MANEEATGKTQGELLERAWAIARKNRSAFLATVDETRPHLRPMAVTVEEDARALYFLTSKDSSKIDQIARCSEVVVAFGDEGSNEYVTFTGQAIVSNDRAKIRELFGVAAKAWWDDADDPEIRVIQVSPNHAELWDGPNRLVAATLMLAAAVTGAKPAIGDHANVPVA